MIKKILFWTAGVIILVLLFLGLRAIWDSTQGDVTQVFRQGFFAEVANNITQGIPYRDITSPAEVTLEQLGELSPVSGMVEIIRNKDSLTETDPDLEYIEIRANITNAEPINISNWSLQSMISDEWIGMPQGTETLVAGAVNERQDIYLYPGESAFIASRSSPVGVSFRVNRCSGFLNSTQTFSPRIRTSCINPRELAPPTIESLQAYGDTCVAFAENFQACTYITPNTDGFSGLSQECREYLQPKLTHNYCVALYGNRGDFYAPQEWRIFLNQDRDLWRERYEIVRLLDEQNRTVDVFNY